MRSARIWQPEQLRHLVERLARGIVQRMSERAVVPQRAHFVQRSVPTRDDEAEPGRRRSRIIEEHSEQMSFEVVHADQRLPRGGGEGLRDLHTHEQRADQTGPTRDADPVEVAEIARGAAQRLGDDR